MARALTDYYQIPLMSKRYEMLTLDLLFDWFYKLYEHQLFDPEYLFVNEKGQQALSDLLKRDLDPSAELEKLSVQQIANPATGRMMYVVVLPTLLDNMMCVGKLHVWNIGFKIDTSDLEQHNG